MKKIVIALIFLCFSINIFAQSDYNKYARFYPIGDDPNLRYISSYTKQEKILVEVNPWVRYSLFNNFLRGMGMERKHTQAWYLSFDPTLRLYNENSFPVKTPTYRFFIGTQQFLQIDKLSHDNKKTYAGFLFESGHYSNGQNGFSFNSGFEDGATQTDSLYSLINNSTILSDILNRKSGNFSTNLSKVVLNFRTYRLDKNNEPLMMHSFNLGFELYHKNFIGIVNFGGYSPYDIKIIGRYRYHVGYEYIKVYRNGDGARISIKENLEIIQGAHPSINPVRNELTFTTYPFIKFKHITFRPTDIGVFISYIYGHDNYNYRLVDSGNQISVGISVNQFPPFAMKKNKK